MAFLFAARRAAGASDGVQSHHCGDSCSLPLMHATACPSDSAAAFYDDSPLLASSVVTLVALASMSLFSGETDVGTYANSSAFPIIPKRSWRASFKDRLCAVSRMSRQLEAAVC